MNNILAIGNWRDALLHYGKYRGLIVNIKNSKIYPLKNTTVHVLTVNEIKERNTLLCSRFQEVVFVGESKEQLSEEDRMFILSLIRPNTWSE